MNDQHSKNEEQKHRSQDTTRASLYGEKNKGYFAGTRNDIVALVPNKENKVLDIGCGTGALLTKLKEAGKAGEIVGIDINKLDSSCELDKLIIGDMEQIKLPYPTNYFDVIICADSLEHLRDPWNTLREIVSYAKRDGLLIASLPNVREWKTLWQIVFKGDFEYTDVGILDRTHLRFFCRKNILSLMNAGGLRITRIYPLMGRKRLFLNRALLGFFEEFLTVQYIIVASKIG